MNERQRDLFLWVWSRRRQAGRAAIGLRGALIGAAGGLLFTLILAPGAPADIPTYNQWGRLFGALGEHLRMLAMAVPAFGFIGWVGADRVFALQERQYQAILATGAQIPAQKPEMQPGDRGPAIAVGIAVAVIVGFIVVLFVMAATGAL